MVSLRMQVLEGKEREGGLLPRTLRQWVRGGTIFFILLEEAIGEGAEK